MGLSAALVLLRHELSDLTQYWGFWMGLFLIAIVMGGKNGILGWLEWGWGHLSRRLAGRGGGAGKKGARDAAG